MKLWLCFFLGLGATSALAEKDFGRFKCRVSLQSYDGMNLKLFRGKNCGQAMRACERKLSRTKHTKKALRPLCRVVKNEQQYKVGRQCGVKLTVTSSKKDFVEKIYFGKSCKRAHKKCEFKSKILNKKGLISNCTRSQNRKWH